MSRWNPFAEIAWPPSAGPSFTPVVDIFEEADAVRVRVDLAGVRPEDVQLDATERLLTIRGKRGLERFSRTFQLPASVQGEAAVAIMSEGILTVRIPRRCSRRSDEFAA